MFLDFFKFLSTEEYNYNIFLDIKTDACIVNRRM
jgi:hypothetical protein